MSTTEPHSDTATRRGRPVLGGISGFFLGLFVWVDLVLLDVVAFESVTFWIFPLLGVLVGVGLAMWAPFGGRGAAPTAAPVADEPDASVGEAIAAPDAADVGGADVGGADDGGGD